jgi:hypothetical protein
MDKILYNFKDGIGYVVEARRGDELLERREGGDCFTDNKTRNTGDLIGRNLAEITVFAAEQMQIMYGMECYPKRDTSLTVST